MKPTLNPSLKFFWEKPSRVKVLYGGRSSSKTWDTAGHAIRLADNFRLKFLCTRQNQNKIEESVYSVLKVQIERFGLQKRFNILNNKIKNRYTGSEFVFYGLARNIDEIKSFEGADICWLEEAHKLTKIQWEILDPTLKKDYSEFWIIFNPDLETDYIYSEFITKEYPDDEVLKRKINYDENPFLSDTMIKRIEKMKAEDYEHYLHIYEGYPRQDSDTAIIKRSWIKAAIDAHIKLGIKPTGQKRLGFDVADDGSDKNATAYAHGFLLKSVKQWKGKEDELLKSCTRAYKEAQAKGALIDYDCIGVGAHAGSKFAELNEGKRKKVVYRKFNAGGKVFDPDKEYKDGVSNDDHFLNAKAQATITLADRFRATYNAVENGAAITEDELLSISSEIEDIEDIVKELSMPEKAYSGNGKIKVDKKEKLEYSPNKADAIIMAFAPQPQPINYRNLL